MNSKRFLLVAVAVLVLVAGLWVGLMVVSDDPLLAQAQQSGAWTSSAPPPDGVDLQGLSPPDRPETASDLDEPEAAGGGCIYAASGSTSATFNVPVYLPQGSEVNHLRFYYSDTAATNSMAWFTVYDLYGQIHAEWPVASTGDAGTSHATTEEFTHMVNYDSFSYVINWRPNELGSDMQVCGFRIYYIPPPGATYLPSVLKNAP